MGRILSPGLRRPGVARQDMDVGDAASRLATGLLGRWYWRVLGGCRKRRMRATAVARDERAPAPVRCSCRRRSGCVTQCVLAMRATTTGRSRSDVPSMAHARGTLLGCARMSAVGGQAEFRTRASSTNTPVQSRSCGAARRDRGPFTLTGRSETPVMHAKHSARRYIPSHISRSQPADPDSQPGTFGP
jgi:hypothetical protein